MDQVSQVVVGAEHIVESGGILNKIGTYNIALIAKNFNIPFYVVAESLKFLEYYPIDQRNLPLDIKVSFYFLSNKKFCYFTHRLHHIYYHSFLRLIWALPSCFTLHHMTRVISNWRQQGNSILSKRRNTVKAG